MEPTQCSILETSHNLGGDFCQGVGPFEEGKILKIKQSLLMGDKEIFC